MVQDSESQDCAKKYVNACMGRAWGGGAIIQLAADIEWGKADSSGGVCTANIVQCRVGVRGESPGLRWHEQVGHEFPISNNNKSRVFGSPSKLQFSCFKVL